MENVLRSYKNYQYILNKNQLNSIAITKAINLIGVVGQKNQAETVHKKANLKAKIILRIKNFWIYWIKKWKMIVHVNLQQGNQLQEKLQKTKNQQKNPKGIRNL